jgi:hypothetical protein
VLAVTGAGWTCIERTPGGGVAVARCDFSGTISLELAEILLSGALRILYAEGTRARSVTLAFNTVRKPIYLEAFQLLLRGIIGIPPGAQADHGAVPPALDALPVKFRSSARSALLPGDRVCAVAHWPAATTDESRWFQHELAPEAALALGGHGLVLIAEERANGLLHVGRENKYGEVATFLPRSRLRDHRFIQNEGPLGALELSIGAFGATERLLIEFPSMCRATIQEVVGRAFREKESAPLAGGRQTS